MADVLYGDVLRAARALLGLSQEDLAGVADVDRRALARLEAVDTTSLNTEVSSKVRRTLERMGIEFTARTESYGSGVRWKSPEERSPIPLPKKKHTRKRRDTNG